MSDDDELTGEDMFGAPVPGEAVEARPPSDTLEGYQPRREWVRGLGGKPIPRDWVRPQQEGRVMTTTAIERPSETPTVTQEQLALIKTTVAVGATDAELKLFLFDCARQGVHPLDRLVHFTKRGGKYTPITSIDFMRIRAADSGEMAGSDDPVFGPRYPEEGQPPDEATVTVYRLTQGQRFAYTATARWDEYKPEQNDFMWRKMPHTMLGKCAEALALRKGFPRQLAGLYAREEMDQAGTDTPDRTGGHAHGDAAEGPTSRRRDAIQGANPATAPTPAQSAVHTSQPEALSPSAPNGGASGIDFELPPGFALIDEVKQDGAFLQVWWGRDAKGGWRKLSTKVPKIANDAIVAAEQRVPVKLHSKDGKYLDRVERLDGGMSKEALAATKWNPDQLVENQSL